MAPSLLLFAACAIFVSFAFAAPGTQFEPRAGPREKMCQACTQAVSEVALFLSYPNLANDSIALIEGNACQLLPEEQQTQCDAAVEEYFPVVLAELQSEVTVDNICVRATHICPENDVRLLLPKGPEDCYACRLVVKLLKKHLQNPKTQAKVKTFLDERCAHITDSTRASECVDAVDKFLPVVFANLDIILDDKKLCKETGLCPKEHDAPQHIGEV